MCVGLYERKCALICVRENNRETAKETERKCVREKGSVRERKREARRRERKSALGCVRENDEETEKETDRKRERERWGVRERKRERERER